MSAVEELVAERDAALAAVERVRAIHPRGETSYAPGEGLVTTEDDEILDGCQKCQMEWPCSDIAALDGAPEATTTEPKPNQYAPCFINGNRTLSILGTINSVREYAETETQMLRDNEAAYPNGTPEAIVIAARYVGPWLPVQGEKP